MGARRLLILSMILCLSATWGWTQQEDSEDEQGRRDNQQQRRGPRYQRPVFLSGKVMMEGGEAPPEPVQNTPPVSGQI